MKILKGSIRKRKCYSSSFYIEFTDKEKLSRDLLLTRVKYLVEVLNSKDSCNGSFEENFLIVHCPDTFNYVLLL